MPRYITFFSYTSASAKALIDRPTDRAAAVKTLVESLGGKLEGFYWMQGDHDGFLIANLPDGARAAALSAAVASTGAVTGMKSHEIFDGETQAQIVKSAKAAVGDYKPPAA